MKYLFTILLALMPILAFGAEKRVPLPDDGGKLYVSIYVQNDAQLQRLIRTNPEIAQYRHGNHYKVYYKTDPMFKARFKNAAVPSAYVQKPDGSVVWSSVERPWCPLRRPQPQPQPDPDDEVIIDEEEEIDLEPGPPPPEPGPNPWFVAAALAAGLTVGAGSKLVEELNTQ